MDERNSTASTTVIGSGGNGLPGSGTGIGRALMPDVVGQYNFADRALRTTCIDYAIRLNSGIPSAADHTVKAAQAFYDFITNSESK
jgi:hypothetical protein